MPLRITDVFANEGSTCKITFVLRDYNANPVSVANITSAVFSLKDARTGQTINNRTATDCLSAFDSGGNFSLTLSAADNVIMNANRKRNPQPYEEHVFTVTISATVNSESIVLQESIAIQVADLAYKP